MKAFIFGLGGGGDVVSTYVAEKYFSLKQYTSVLGAVTWERYVEDPVPGPICKDDFVNVKSINEVITEVYPNSYAIRENNLVIPQLVRYIKIKNISSGYSICVKKGPKEIANGIEELVSRLGIDVIIGVDAGGDVLAKGCEESLGSPLIDFIMLSALVELERRGYNVILSTIGSGSDGELDQDYILQRIAEIARFHGLIDAKGIDRGMEEDFEKILSNVNTEASRIPFEAFRGLYGEYKIRNGLRKVKVTPISSIMFFLDPEVVANTSPLYQIVKDSNDLEDANRRMNEVGIYTEYNFEMDLYKRFGINSKNQPVERVMKVREEGLNALGKRRLNC